MPGGPRDVRAEAQTAIESASEHPVSTALKRFASKDTVEYSTRVLLSSTGTEGVVVEVLAEGGVRMWYVHRPPNGASSWQRVGVKTPLGRQLLAHALRNSPDLRYFLRTTTSPRLGHSNNCAEGKHIERYYRSRSHRPKRRKPRRAADRW